MKKLIASACLLLSALTLGACSTAQTTSATESVTAGLTATQADVAQAVQLYGIAKGLAKVAALSNPSMAPEINTVISKADPVVATLTPLVTGAEADIATDAPAIAAEVATLVAQANALTLVAAPAINVVKKS
jgi:hypothetical protein